MRALLLCAAVLSAGASGRAQSPPAPETLSDAWTVALAADRNGLAARQQTEAALHTLDAARAARLPVVDLEGAYTALSRAPVTIIDAGPIAIPGFGPVSLPFDRLAVGQDRSLSYNASATLPLFTGGAIKEGINAASSQVERARAAERAAMLETRMAVAEAYVAVLRVTRLLETIDHEVNGLASHATDAANLVAQGVAARNDRLAADVALADARQRRIQAANGLDAARAAYNRLLGRDLGEELSLVDPHVALPEGDLDALIIRALQRRPELDALDEEAQTSVHRAAQLAAGVRPQVAAVGGYAYQQNRYQLYPGFWSAGVRVRWNLFDGGGARANTSAARAQASSTRTRQAETRSRVTLQVRQAWLDVQSARERIAVTRDAVEQADENARVATDRYTAGIGTASEVLDAETLRARSGMNAALATYDHVLAILRLRCAVGDL